MQKQRADDKDCAYARIELLQLYHRSMNNEDNAVYL